MEGPSGAGYELDNNPTHKYAAIQRIWNKKAVQFYRLGAAYDLPATRERIEKNRQRYARDFSYHRYRPIPVQWIRPIRPRHLRLDGSLSGVRRIGGFQVFISTTATAWASCPKERSVVPFPRNCGRTAAVWTPSASRRS